jgi:hypothetical protein
MHVMNDSPRPLPFPGAIGALTLAAILLTLTAPTAGQCAVQRLDPDTPQYHGSFGAGLAVEGDVALIGEVFDDEYGEDVGSVSIYRFDGSQWVMEGKLPPPSDPNLRHVGAAIDIDGDVAIVGAFDSEDGGYGSISALIYRFNGAAWEEEACLPASDQGCGRISPTEWVGIDGDVACVGAYSDDSLEGAVYVYRRQPVSSVWIEEQRIQAHDGHHGDDFGNDLSLQGDELFVCAPLHDHEADDTGAAYVFGFDPHGPEWVEEAELLPSTNEPDAYFGSSVSVSQDRLVIGATGQDHEDKSTGAAYVYSREDDVWVLETILTDPDGEDGDFFGQSCAIEGDTILIGAMSVDAGVENVGAVCLFRRDGDAWVALGRFVNAAGSEGDHAGDVAIGGSGALVSAFRADGPEDDCGAVFSLALDGEDCNHNNMCDWIDLAEGISEDCNNNQVPDECDIAFDFRDESGHLSPIGDVSPKTYIIEAPPLVFEGDVRIDFTASADLESTDEYIRININEYSFGAVFAEHAGLCSSPADREHLTIPKILFNYLLEAGDDLVIAMTASDSVDAGACDGNSWIAVEINYWARGEGDANHNGIPDECECPADLDGDGDVDTADLLFLLGAWGTAEGDVDFDGDTDTADLLALLGAWGECPE